jgi:glycosyltransferase involved in cell wall biosynthesis
MISILIPVYNVTVFPLVQELSNQLKKANVEGEILVYDDFSDDVFRKKNSTLTHLSQVLYKEMDKNYGRTFIRQLLAKDASFNRLLFIDGDSTIIDKNFLRNYFEAIGEQDNVYVGGRLYQPVEPAACNKRLHWKYGTERESLKGRTTALHTNNFCIAKDVFLQLNFPKEMSGYGHEDTWMELVLVEKQKTIEFIDNPVLHEGLEDTAVFLEKTKNALRNLLVLANIFGEKLVRNKIALYNLFYWQHKLGLSEIVRGMLNKKINKIEKKLLSCNPSLLDFDLYRLFYLTAIAKEKQIK